MKVTNEMLTRAMKEAVKLGIFPKYAVGEVYLKHWENMQSILVEALKEEEEQTPLIDKVLIGESLLEVILEDTRHLILPLHEFPKLSNATKEQRDNFELIGKGEGIHWPDLNEDLSVKGFFDVLAKWKLEIIKK